MDYGFPDWAQTFCVSTLLYLLRVSSALVSVSLMMPKLHESTIPISTMNPFLSSPAGIDSSLFRDSVLHTCHLPTIAQMAYVPQNIHLWRHICPANSKFSGNACWPIHGGWWERENGKTETCTFTGFLFDPSFNSFNNLFSVHFLLWLVLHCFFVLYFIFLLFNSLTSLILCQEVVPFFSYSFFERFPNYETPCFPFLTLLFSSPTHTL